MAEQPAYYARQGGALADGWTLLHPPYTVWHLSYAVLGAALAPRLAWTPLLLTVLAFFLAVGVAAHALDERAGHPLRTDFGDGSLVLAATVALLGAVALGAYGAFWYAGPNWPLAVAVPVGVAVVVGYNLELAGGRLHNDLTFGLGWGGFPVVVGYLAQQPGVGVFRPGDDAALRELRPVHPRGRGCQATADGQRDLLPTARSRS